MDTVAVTPISWYKSKTIWFNVISFFLIAAPLFSAYVVSAGIGEDRANQIGSLLGLATGLGNAAIRFFWTTAPIAGPPQS